MWLFSFLDIHTVYLRKRLFPNLASSSVVQLEMMCVWWERFSSESEMLSLWISEKEKELESITSTSSMDPLDKNISRLEVCHVFSSLTTFLSVMYFSSPWHFSYQSRQVSTLTWTAYCTGTVFTSIILWYSQIFSHHPQFYFFCSSKWNELKLLSGLVSVPYSIRECLRVIKIKMKLDEILI